MPQSNLSWRSLSWAIVLLLFFSSCKKDIHSIPSGVLVDNKANKASILPFPLDWEGANNQYMPSPTTLLAPWAFGSNQEFISDIAFDYKVADGWELVFNTFSTTGTTSPAFFALYNKWRGLLRLYLYLPPSTPTSSTYLNDGLSLSGVGVSPMLNYIGAAQAIDYNNNVRNTSQVEPFKIQASGGWQVGQYEIAFDPNIQTVGYDQLKMIWTMQAVNVDSFNVSGAINGTIAGTISQQAAAPDLSGTVTSAINAAYTGMGQSLVNLTPAAAGLSTAMFNAGQSAIQSGLNGIVKNIFSGIFGGSSSPTVQQVQLALSASITLKGTLTSTSGLGNPSLVIPGCLNSQTAPGYVPGYLGRMGVFYLSAKPKVNITEVIGGVINSYQGYHQNVVTHNYALDNNSFAVVYNPDVINGSPTGAHIENFKKELIYFGPTSGPIGTWISADGTQETVGAVSIQSNCTYSNNDQWFGPGIPLHQSHGATAVRISFNVVPNTNPTNISPLIVKTFYTQEVYL